MSRSVSTVLFHGQNVHFGHGIEVSATGRTLAQRSPIEWGVSEYDREETLAHWGGGLSIHGKGGWCALLCVCLKLSAVAGTVVNMMYYRCTGSLFCLTFVCCHFHWLVYSY